MATSSVTSTRSRVKSRKAREILSRYVIQGMDFRIDEKGYLQAFGEGNSSHEWPLAVPVSVIPPKHGLDREQYRALVRDVYLERGAEGFAALLRELAFCLEKPMMILAVWGGERGRCGGCAWRIAPGSAVVQELYACDEPNPAVVGEEPPQPSAGGSRRTWTASWSQ